MLNFCSLFSSSSANCLLVTDKNTKVLIDCGSSLKRTSAALLRLGIDIADIDAILVTHEHSDHISGIPLASSKYNIPVYANQLTYNAMSGKEKIKNLNIISFDEFNIGTLTIIPFKTPHDSACSCGFVIKSGKSQLTVATDLGHIDREILKYFYGSEFVFLESNHDIQLLLNGPYPYSLKRRILSDVGHLSNNACSDLVCHLASNGVKKFMLGHLSESNNTPDIALKTTIDSLNFNNLSVESISVAPKEEISEIITI